jgi:hypothetical protein
LIAAATATPPPLAAASSQLKAPVAATRRLINLANLADGASVLAANPEARRPERAIDTDVDSFMKNDCIARKWIMVELSQVGQNFQPISLWPVAVSDTFNSKLCGILYMAC